MTSATISDETKQDVRRMEVHDTTPSMVDRAEEHVDETTMQDHRISNKEVGTALAGEKTAMLQEEIIKKEYLGKVRKKS